MQEYWKAAGHALDQDEKVLSELPGPGRTNIGVQNVVKIIPGHCLKVQLFFVIT